MKSFVIALAVLFLATLASATDFQEKNSIMDEDLMMESEGNLHETPRFGFLNLNNDGATLTFNSTSLQYAVVIGIILLVVALVAIPLLGLDLANVFAPRDDYYPYHQGYDQTQGYSSYTNFAKRFAALSFSNTQHTLPYSTVIF